MFRKDLAIVTPSYRPDLKRCKTLCASVKRFVDPEIEHILVVPRRDRAAFAPLANERTRIETVESILPKFAVQLPFQRKWWLTLCSIPVRGWILQQLTKLSTINAVTTDAIMFADSDLAFIRPFTADQVWHDGKLRMHRVPGPAPTASHRRWHQDTGQLMGLKPLDWYGADYIGQLITWHCDTVRGMLDHITETAGKHWFKVMANMLQLSEYMLYGIYVEHVLKGEGHHYTQDDLCHCSWHHDMQTQEDIDRFFGRELDPRVCAVLIQSNLNIEPAVYAKQVEHLVEMNAGPASLNPHAEV
ncbi:MAG: DUF6492 family protein [Planctomycetota bacterium]